VNFGSEILINVDTMQKWAATSGKWYTWASKRRIWFTGCTSWSETSKLRCFLCYDLCILFLNQSQNSIVP